MYLVFGKNGQVARHLSNFENVKCLDRCSANLENLDNCRYVILKNRPAAVINAAAFTDVDKAETEVNLVNRVNAYAPEIMAKACKELDIPFIHLSSEYVFDGTGDKPKSPDDKPKPINQYGLSKLASEKLVMEAFNKAIIIRTSWIFSGSGKNFVSRMLELSKTRSEISVVSDQIGGPTSALSISNAIISMLKMILNDNSYSGSFGLYHYSGWPDVSWAEFAREIFKQKKKQTLVLEVLSKDYITKANRPLNSRLDCSKTLKDFQLHRPDWKIDLKQL